MLARLRAVALATACPLAVVAAPTSAAAAPLPRPMIAAPSAAHVISTPAGRRLVVAIRVTYRLGSAVRTRVPHARLTGRLDLTARLPDGTTLHSSDLSQVASASSRVLEHHVFFRASDTQRLRAAGTRVRLAIAARETVDTNGDGRDDLSSRSVRSAHLPAITAPTADGDVFLGHAKGSDPCGYYGLSQCLDVPGSTVTAHHFWQSNTQVVDCPSTGFPYTNQDTTTLTSSNHYIETTWIFTGDTAAHITITDDNVHGHPYTYQPWIACTATDPGGGSGPYVTG